MLFGIIASMTLALSAGTASGDPAEVEGVAQTSNAARPPEAPTVSEVDGSSVVRWRGRTLVSDDRCSGICGLSLVDSSPTRVGDTYFYLYEIPSAGGGNACDGYDYYVVTIRGAQAWASDSLGECIELEETKPSPSGIELAFSETFQAQAQFCHVAFGSAECATRKLDAQSVSTETVEGNLSRGFGYTNDMPFVQPDGEAGPVIIDDNGRCEVERNIDNRVVATIRTTTFPNGVTQGECLDLRVAGEMEAATNSSASGQETAQSSLTELVRAYLALSGAREAAEVAIPRVLDSLRAAMPAVPQRFWRDFAKELDASEIVELNVPSYERRFSRDELLAMIAFYMTPAGQKLAKQLPDITNEVMVAGGVWGRAVGERVVKRLAETGYR
jgi:hypothetical protein